MINDRNVKLKLWSLALVIFFLGGITGAAMHALYKVKVEGKPPATTSPNPSQQPRMSMSERMKQELNLTDEQSQKIKSIIDDSRKEFQRVVKDECPGIKDMRAKTNERIKSVLTPEQQQKFDEMRQKREAMMKEREKDENKD